MSYRTLTVCLDDGRDAAGRLGTALGLATRHGAFLNGIHLSYMPSPVLAAYEGAEGLYETLRQDLRLRQAAARDHFLGAAASAGVPAGFLAASNLELTAVTACARACDLLIAGQPAPTDTAAHIGDGFPSRFAFELGRPVLFLPPGPREAADFPHVMVAWNGSRESTRALFDALPLLRRARRVTLVSLLRGPSPAPAHGPVPAADIEGLLRRHGVQARMLVDAGHDDPGEWLLARATDVGDPADLLVAGAYGHGRLTERVLGGVTRTLLEARALPLLLSH